jgi:hypothetical protein
MRRLTYKFTNLVSRIQKHDKQYFSDQITNEECATDKFPLFFQPITMWIVRKPNGILVLDAVHAAEWNSHKSSTSKILKPTQMHHNLTSSFIDYYKG